MDGRKKGEEEEEEEKRAPGFMAIYKNCLLLLLLSFIPDAGRGEEEGQPTRWRQQVEGGATYTRHLCE